MGGVTVACAVLNRPRRAATLAWFAPDAWRAFVLTYAALLAFTLATAASVWLVPGGPALARELLRLSLTAAHNPPPSVAGVISIAANNTLHSVWPLSLGLIDAPRRRVARALADVLVTANLLVPGLLVGAALAAYAMRALPYLPHTPVEFAGVAIGSAGWIVERNRPVTARERILCAGATVLLLLVGATIETYLVPHR